MGDIFSLKVVIVRTNWLFDMHVEKGPDRQNYFCSLLWPDCDQLWPRNTGKQARGGHSANLLA